MTKRERWKSAVQKVGDDCEKNSESLCSMVMIFFSMSLAGWLWEVGLHLITDGSFVNRGFLHGPWLPIYGSGSVLILVFLNKLRKRPLLEFLSIILLCVCIEYYISWFLVTIF